MQCIKCGRCFTRSIDTACPACGFNQIQHVFFYINRPAFVHKLSLETIYELIAKNEKRIYSADKYSSSDSVRQLPEKWHEELDVRIGIRISKGLTQQELAVFDALYSPSEYAAWLDCHVPNYRSIVEEEVKQILREYSVSLKATASELIREAEKITAQ